MYFYFQLGAFVIRACLNSYGIRVSGANHREGSSVVAAVDPVGESLLRPGIGAAEAQQLAAFDLNGQFAVGDSPAKTRMAFSASASMAFSAARARSWKKVTSSFASSSLTALVPALDM